MKQTYEELLAGYEGLIKAYARTYYRNVPTLEIEDLEQELRIRLHRVWTWIDAEGVDLDLQIKSSFRRLCIELIRHEYNTMKRDPRRIQLRDSNMTENDNGDVPGLGDILEAPEDHVWNKVYTRELLDQLVNHLSLQEARVLWCFVSPTDAFIEFCQERLPTSPKITVEGIALWLNMPYRQVRSARDKIKRMLEEDLL